jgi:AcrR family transcriptional regulator
MDEAAPIPRGRHAPPREVRRERQRERLFTAAAAVFTAQGYSDATAEAIAKEAGMSKATFYEHFANKEQCVLELFDAAAAAALLGMKAASDGAGPDPRDQLRARIAAFLNLLASFPNTATTLLVTILGAGPEAAERHSQIVARFAEAIDENNREAAAQGAMPRFASPDDPTAIAGAVVELAASKLRQGRAEEIPGLAPLVERLILGLLTQRTEA